MSDFIQRQTLAEGQLTLEELNERWTKLQQQGCRRDQGMAKLDRQWYQLMSLARSLRTNKTMSQNSKLSASCRSSSHAFASLPKEGSL